MVTNNLQTTKKVSNLETTKTQASIKDFFNKPEIQIKIEEMLGKRSTQFVTSVIQIAQSNELLKNADPQSVLNAAITAATLDLPLNNSLGLAYLVPFNEKQKDGSYKQKAQFILGYKSYIQLAQRSGQFKTISSTPIYDGQIKSENPLTGYEFDFTVKSDKLIGYAAYFELINGFSKIMYMNIDQLKAHGVKYSQTFKKGFGLWKDDFDAMAQKTVLKLLLSKFAPLSVQMQNAIIADQGVVKEITPNTVDIDYVDNSADEQAKIDEVKFDKEHLSLINKIKTSSSIELDEIEKSGALNDYDISSDLIKERRDELKKGAKVTQSEIKLP